MICLATTDRVSHSVVCNRPLMIFVGSKCVSGEMGLDKPCFIVTEPTTRHNETCLAFSHMLSRRSELVDYQRKIKL